MKYLRLPLLALSLLAITAMAAQAAQLASAKVLSANGTVTKHLADGSKVPVSAGDILSQGDSIVTTALSTAELVFSNGSTLLVEENTSLSLLELNQEAFSGNKSYEQLAGDPSKSQTLLELNYGEVDGHVKQLKTGSTFDIKTSLGTAAIRGTKFRIELRYNPVAKEFILFVTNKDGKVDVTSRYAGNVEFGRGSVGDKSYDSQQPADKSAPLPPAHTIIIRISPSDPNFEEVISFLKNIAPGDFRSSRNPSGQTIIRSGFGDGSDAGGDAGADGDTGVIVVSPEGPSITPF